MAKKKELAAKMEELQEQKAPQPTNAVVAGTEVKTAKPAAAQKAGPAKKAEAKPKAEQSKVTEPKAAESKVEQTPAKPVSPENVLMPDGTFYHQDGPGKAYKFWSREHKTWLVTQDFWAARQIGGDLWDVIWVWYKDGQIHHDLDEAEILEYLPK